MLLIQIPQEIHLLIIETGDFSINELKSLSFTCRHFAYLCLSEIWKTRRFIENNSLTKFRNTILNNPLLPYGDFILKLQVDELEKEPPILIDDELIKFFSENFNNLKEIMLRFSEKKRKNMSCLLPLELLGDRLVNLSMVAYDNRDDDKREGQDNEKSVETKVMELVNGVCAIFNKSTTIAKPKSQKICEIQKTENNVEFHDALSETVKLGCVKSIRLYYPKMAEKVWESFTSNAADSLQAMRITLNNPTMIVSDPSIIVSLFGKYCKNLRVFDIESFQPISKESTLLMLENCKKLEYLDISASGEIVPLLYKSGSIKSLYLSYPLNGNNLNQINNMMENLKKLSLLQINGKSNFSFLKNFPNLEYLSIGDFGEMNDEGFLNISKSNIRELILIKTPKISDEALRMLGSMKTLTIFNIRARLPNVTQEGWINLVKRPIGHPSWSVITIDDGRQINPEFFKILDNCHHKLERIRIRGFNYDNLLKDDSFDNLVKFKDAWSYYKYSKKSSTPVILWPIKTKAIKNSINIRREL